MKRLRLTSANDLRDIAITLEIHSRKKHKETGIPNEKYKELVAPERREDIYFSVLQGRANQRANLTNHFRINLEPCVWLRQPRNYLLF
jgi:hypothetical protein